MAYGPAPASGTGQNDGSDDEAPIGAGPTGEGPAQAGAPGVPAEHPEARGFGNQRRLRSELIIALVIILALPLAVVWGARELAGFVAMRLPAGMDERLGRPTWEALRVSGQLCNDSEAQRYVESLAAPLLAALGETPFQFRFMVSSSDDVNAFALPGGYVVVNQGLLTQAESGEEVAAVLAHELSHVTLRHSTQRLAGSLGASAALALALGFVDIGAPAYTVAHLSGLHYERAQESEADEQGRRLLIGAGLSPLGMATFFERLSRSPAPPAIISTHPDPGDRAAAARLAARGIEPHRQLPSPPRLSCE
jgi:predicted Zn-dependent protease